MTQIVRYYTPTGVHTGLVDGDTIHTLQGDLFSGLPLIHGPAIMPLAEARLAPPVRPSKIVCVGRNYAAHAAEHHAEIPSEPMLFLKPPSALIGPGDAIQIPQSVGRVEHESELAVVIGRRARRVARQDALACVLGYTCANDVSARELQKKDGQWGRAKGLDTFLPLGPWIVTGLDPADLAVRCAVNGAARQVGRTSQMVFDVPFLIEFIARYMTLEPGDVILTGTPSGVAPLADGDVVRVEVEGVGALENPVRVLAE